MTRSELLDTWAQLLPSSPGVAEIGVLRGTFSRKILKVLAPSRFLMVDAWRHFPVQTYADYPTYTDAHWLGIYQKVKERFDGEPGVQIVRELSLNAARVTRPGSLDLVYLDSNHSYDAVQADLRAWVPAVKPGGIFAGHDYDLKSVRQAVTEFRAGAPVSLTSERSCVTYWWRV